MRKLINSICLALAILAIGCSRSNDAADESLFYGTWIKGSAAGDTLQFGRKNNQHILRRNMSFNPNLPSYQEVAYQYKNGKLLVEFAGAGSGLREIDSFGWKTVGKVFELQGYQMYLFMSSTQTRFTYTKID